MKKKFMWFIVALIIVIAICGAIIYWLRPTKYTVTQYASESGNQSLIYSITDNKGHLVLVDGGWEQDAEQVKNIININGGKVDAWILTHPHEDHIWAFNTIMRDSDIKVGKIYVSDFNYDAYKSQAADWDAFWAYEDFLAVTSKMDNICELKAGDEVAVIGLDMKIYNSYSNKIEGTDAANDGSLMFELSGKEESILFCGDVGKSMSDTLISQWDEELKADYIQMGHHGNGGLSETFYRMVQPKAAFFDTPDWLMYPEEGSSYTTPINREIMESMGCKIYSYDTAPNIVEFK